MKKTYRYLYAMIVGLTTLSLASCDKPPEKIAEQSADQLHQEQTPFETTANEIAKEYADNPVAADNKFKDATFNVSGIITDTSKNFIKEPFVSLEGGTEPGKEPQFAFQQSEKDQAAELQPGQSIRLQCIGQGNISKIPMAGECKILE